MNLEGGKIRENAPSTMRGSHSMVCDFAREERKEKLNKDQFIVKINRINHDLDVDRRKK